MTNIELVNRIQQQKMNALAAKYLHGKRLNKLHILNSLVDLLALVVPILYFAVRYIAKDTSWMKPVEIIWEILAVILLSIVVCKLILKWQDSAEKHTKLMGDNIGFIAHINYLLTQYQNKNINDDALSVFLLSAEQDKADAETLTDVKESERQTAYRESLKQIEPGSVSTVCPVCGASPWAYKSGNCQLCGNTPKGENK
ncbi:MAG: mobilome CxxCx(11)CxxC protein [Acidobacteriota bacterium]